MRIAHFLYIVLLFPLTGVCGDNVNEETKIPLSLCDSGDSVYFSCDVKNEKTISLCGKKIENQLSTLYYRFGKAGKIELEFPSDSKTSSLTKFTYNWYMRPQTEYVHIGFVNRSQKYVIYSYSSYDPKDERLNYGIFGTDPNDPEQKEQFNIRCASNAVDNLHLLSEVLPCDVNGAFGCEK